ncbi:hypothetical protein AB0B48_15215 [Micromonospora sp. NPDC049089]|uniref:hypothetical protein n=1 Tax=Micromonospora sp. NPDC049089 TaxID=3155496 RepID=UPI0033EC7763
MKLTLVTGLTGLLLLGTIVELLRRRQLREKYGMLWLACRARRGRRGRDLP